MYYSKKFKKIIKQKNSLPWCNFHIRRLIRKKQRRYNAARRSGSDHDRHCFRKVRKLIHKELDKAHQEYVNNLLEINNDRETNGNPNADPDRRDQTGISTLKSNDKEFTDPKQKAEILSSHFSTVFTDGDPVLPSMPPSEITDTPNITSTCNGVVKLLGQLNPSKANGPNQIPTRVLKEAAPAIALYLCYIFQQLLDSGDVPADWRHANISAIYKKGSRVDAANYRPISLTSVPCKIMEHIICHNIMIHLNKHDILVDYQHGFRKNHSCETQLINTVEHVARSIDGFRERLRQSGT